MTDKGLEKKILFRVSFASFMSFGPFASFGRRLSLPPLVKRFA